jgi:hypothetical protein
VVRNVSRCAATAADCSRCGQCPASSTATRCVEGRRGWARALPDQHHRLGERVDHRHHVGDETTKIEGSLLIPALTTAREIQLNELDTSSPRQGDHAVPHPLVIEETRNEDDCYLTLAVPPKCGTRA